MSMAVTRFFTPRWPRFNFRAVDVGFVVDKAAMGQIFLRILLFFPVNHHITNVPLSFITTHIIWIG
jgi:hypothetical protein